MEWEIEKDQSESADLLQHFSQIEAGPIHFDLFWDQSGSMHEIRLAWIFFDFVSV